MRKFAGLFIIFLFVLTASTTRPVHVFMAGDSTMADKPLFKNAFDSVSGDSVEETFLERGWGQLLPEFVQENVLVKNLAQNGRSTRTFIQEGWWTKIMDQLHPGDFVILQFGHNDCSVAKGERYTNPVQFRLNFIAFVNEIKSKGATPVLCTPVARRKFDSNGNLIPTHGVYPDIIRNVAKEQNVTLVDMEKLTSNWLLSEGVESSRRYFHKFPPRVSRLYPKGLDDNTHYNEAGARIVSGMFVGEVKLLNSGFKKILK